MKVSEFITKMRTISENSSNDPEAAHSDADRLLIEYMKDAIDKGYLPQTAAQAIGWYESVWKWYA